MVEVRYFDRVKVIVGGGQMMDYCIVDEYVPIAEQPEPTRASFKLPKDIIQKCFKESK